MKVKEESAKVVLKLSIQKSKIMVSRPIISWQIDGEKMETVTNFIFLGSKITANGDCGHEIKRRLLLRRKLTTNLDSIFKNRDITLPTKVHLVKALVFGEGNGYPLQYSCLDIPTDRVAWWSTVYFIEKSQIQLSS